MLNEKQVNQQRKVCGTITERDILRKVTPYFSDETTRTKSAETGFSFLNAITMGQHHQIFIAATAGSSTEASPDWCEEILKTADPKIVGKVRAILAEGRPNSEAELAVQELDERPR